MREPDGSIYDPLEKYPGGFTPRFFGEVFDFSILGGFRGTLDNGLSHDFSGRRGESEVQYTLSNTINPSQGPASKKSFKPGDLINTETQFQADFTYEFESDFASPLLLAFGGSYMDEEYEVVEGEPDSYEAGPYSYRIRGDSVTPMALLILVSWISHWTSIVSISNQCHIHPQCIYRSDFR